MKDIDRDQIVSCDEEDEIIITLKKQVLSEQMEKVEDRLKELLMDESIAAEIYNTVTQNEQTVTLDDIMERKIRGDVK